MGCVVIVVVVVCATGMPLFLRCGREGGIWLVLDMSEWW